VASRLGYADPKWIVRIHLNLLAVPRDSAILPNQTPEEKLYLDQMKHWLREEPDCQCIHGTKPQTLAFGLADSPVGLAAWIMEKFRSWSDERGPKRMHYLLRWFGFFFLTGYVVALNSTECSSDEPDFSSSSTVVFQAVSSYEHALRVWKIPEDINTWIAANFSYCMERALRLSETQRAQDEKISIYEPSEFFAKKIGMCLDISRFAVETLKRIDPDSNPKYLMVEFDPVQIHGNTLRLHWLVMFKRDGKLYFFADSKRPGHIAGPYNDIQSFITEYERYRGRRIIAFQELESYQKKRRTRVFKRQRFEKP
jgi:hypothetical protein